LSLACLKLKDYTQAIQYLEKCKECTLINGRPLFIGNDKYHIIQSLGKAYYHTGEYAKAVTHFMESYSEVDPLIYIYLYKCHVKLNERGKAKEWAKECRKEEYSFSRIDILDLARFCHEHEDFPEAVYWYQKFLETHSAFNRIDKSTKQEVEGLLKKANDKKPLEDDSRGQ
jgi:tetratricopeptide (TPR) repeat protein